MRLALGAFRREHRGDEHGLEDLRMARIVAGIHGEQTGDRALSELIALYLSYDTDQRAQHIQADSLYREGTALYHAGAHTEALDLFFCSLARHQSLGDRRSESLDLSRIAGLLDMVGETDKARQHARQSIDLGREVGCTACVGAGLHALGAIEIHENNLQRAIEVFRQTHQLGLVLGEDTYVAGALGMLANAYYLAGRYHEALAMHEEALDLYRRMNFPRGMIGVLINMADIYSTDLTQHQEAIGALREAIDISVEQDNDLMEAHALHSLARTEWALENYRDAYDTVSGSIRLFESLDETENLAVALSERSGVLRAMGQTEEAQHDVRRALEVARKGVSPYALCEILTNLAIIETDMGNPERALSHGMEAIELLEATRSRIRAEELRASSLYLRTYIYEGALAPLLAMHRAQPEAGHEAEAFRLIEQCKSRTMLDFISARRISGLDGHGDFREQLAEQLSSLQLELLGPLEDEDTRLGIRREIRGVRARLDSLEMAALAESPAVFRDAIALADFDPADLRRGEDLFVEYLWGWETVYGVAVTGDETRFFRVGSTDDLEGLIAIYGALIRDFSRPAFDSPAAFRLADMLLKPIRDVIATQDRLILIPDGPLLGVPVEALPFALDHRENRPEGDWQFLVQHFDIGYAPSATLWRYLTDLQADRDPAPCDLAAFGNPTLEREAGGHRWRPLAYAELELAELGRLLSPRRSVFHSDLEATEQRLKSLAAEDYRVLHFATHAYSSPVDPSASGLLLAPSADSDGFLASVEIVGLNLPVDLVTLSACDTGRGRLVSGEGVLGLSRAFFYAGAASILASLWEVDDEHTAHFMGRLYHHLTAGESKGQALTLAKREAIAGEAGLSSHPYYWAPFVILGDCDGVLDLTPRSWYEQAMAWPILGLALAGILAVGRLVTWGRRKQRSIHRSTERNRDHRA
jgi:CHAT domain-containing protein/tetratricopeptide (TPR) repeat protein